ncbi:hypothetical protein IQ07DRAFT_214127 [Pyrenochaeta sp. DS3sAY3a]|nr:hypothetical protein IQ07DRAFT_214127 [Pyrenochaeta sp. DS3sAY3a]
MFSYQSLVVLLFASTSLGVVLHPRGSANESTPYSNVTFTPSVSLQGSTLTSETYSTTSLAQIRLQQSVEAVESSPSSEYASSLQDASNSTGREGTIAPAISTAAVEEVIVTTTTALLDSSESSRNATISAPYLLPNATLPATRISNATCTINIPSANVEWWYPPTYSHRLGTMTTAAANFTNADSYTLVPHTTTFDVASALESDFVCTSSSSYVSEWDFTMVLCMDYTEKPTAAATSIAYRTAAAPFPPGGVIPVSDAMLYDLYTDGQPSATATVSVAPNITYTETSATPFVYFTAYEVESGNTTETIQLRSAYAYPYWVKGIEHESTATGSIPEGFLEQIPQSACDGGHLTATVTVLIVVDLFYQNWPNADPFIIHLESTAVGFEDPPVVINGEGTSRGQPLTIADWDLPGVVTKPTSASIKPNQRPDPVPTTPGGGNSNNVDTQAPQVPNVPQPTSVTVGTIGGTVPIVIGPSSEVAVGSQTLSPGGPAIIVGGVTPVSLAPSATAIVVGGTTSQLPQLANPPAQTQVRPPPILTIGSSTLTPNAATQFFIAPGQTLTPGGVVTLDNTIVSLAPSASFVVIGGSTQLLTIPGSGSQSAASAPSQIIFGGSTITAQPTVGGSGNSAAGPTFIIADQTLAPGGPAITVSGTTISLATSASFIVINGVTSAIANPATPQITPPPLTIGNGVFRPLPGSGTSYLIGSSILTPGGSVVLADTTKSSPSHHRIPNIYCCTGQWDDFYHRRSNLDTRGDDYCRRNDYQSFARRDRISLRKCRPSHHNRTIPSHHNAEPKCNCSIKSKCGSQRN